MTDEEKIEYKEARSKLKIVSGLCCTFECICLVSSLIWIGFLMFTQPDYTVPIGLTSIIIGYLIFLPSLQSNGYTKWKEFINICFMILGAYMLINLTAISETALTLIDIPLIIIYIWTIIGCESYRNFNVVYRKWKRLDEIYCIEMYQNNVIQINRHVFNLKADKDKIEIEQCEKYKKVLKEKIDFLKEKHGR